MLGRTHLFIGLLSGLVALPYFSSENQMLFVGIAVISALLPDVDQHASIINRLLFFSKIFSKIFKHRGFTHSILATVLGYMLFFLTLSPNYAIAFAIGYLSHLFADAITIEGVNFFYPFPSRIAGPIRTGSLIENFVLVGVLVGIITVLLYL